MDGAIGIKLIVGLGNPGLEYQTTRHNVGFMIIDRLLKRFTGEKKEKKVNDSLVCECGFKGRTLLTQKPQTFMNLSGNAVAPLMRKQQLIAPQLLLIHDDLDLPLGRMRIRRGGSAGGHHGVESVINGIGSADFVRIRVGIGHGKNTVDHVLGGFAGEEAGLIDKVIDQAVEAALSVLTCPLNLVMTKYNGLDLREPATESADTSSN